MTLDEIARLAGVSRTTASYVINGKAAQYRISQQTQKKVQTIVEQYNFRPNQTASALRVGVSRLLGLIIPDLENISYAKIAKQLESKARAYGYQLIICCFDDEPKTEQQVVNTLLSRNIDGLIVASSLGANNGFYLNIQKNGIPVIAIDRVLNDEHFACVISEDLEGANTLTRQLVAQGAQSIGLIGAVPELGISKERELGFLSAVHHTNVAYQTAYGQHFCQEEGKRLILAWQQQNALPHAILTTSYSLFEGVLEAIVEQPTIATQCKFATFGDNRMLDFIALKVHSLTQQRDLISQRALDLLLQAIKGNYQAGVDVIPRKAKWRH